MKRLITFLLLSFSATLSSLCQTPPPNDNLTNATVLTGSDVTFTGCLAGSTLEDVEEQDFDGGQGLVPYITGSIWWSWTAPATTILNLVVTVQPPYRNGLVTYYDGIVVFPVTNTVTSPAQLTRPTPTPGGSVSAGLNPEYLSFPVTAGSNYLITLAGSSSNIYTLHLVATNAPLIFKQPLSQTVYSNESVVFYVVAGGLQPRTCQWFFNGTAIPSETTPILGLYNINSSMVGSYSVLVSNATGSVMSQSATLSISQSNVPPVLSAVGISSNSLAFSLAGEIGRAYRIESSTNLVDWSAERSFPAPPAIGVAPTKLEYVYTTNSTILLNVTNNSQSKFFRASIYHPPDADSEICVNNLRQIVIAKYLTLVDGSQGVISRNSGGFFAMPWDDLLTPYLAHVTNMYCPLDSYQYMDTSYDYQWMIYFPTCNIDGNNHVVYGVP